MFPHPFTFNLYVSHERASLKQHVVASFFLIRLTISVFELFNIVTFDVIIDRVGFTFASLLFVFYKSHIFRSSFTAFFCIT